MPEGIGYTNTQVLPPVTTQPTPPVEKTESLENRREEQLKVEALKNEQRVETERNDQPVEVEPVQATSTETVGSQVDIFV